jgi:hypothetical protein
VGDSAVLDAQLAKVKGWLLRSASSVAQAATASPLTLVTSNNMPCLKENRPHHTTASKAKASATTNAQSPALQKATACGSAGAAFMHVLSAMFTLSTFLGCLEKSKYET